MNDIVFTCQFAVDDFKAKHAGSALGSAWAFVQPIVTICMYWFVFQLGFRSAPVEGFPFVLWLVAGLVPWFFISDSIPSATYCLTEYSYLVKKVLFNIDILPIAKLLSTLIIQGVLVLFVVILYAAFGYFPDKYYLLLPLYLIYMMFLTIGISYITSTVYVFLKDTLQIVTIFLQFLFWATPIVWNLEMMPQVLQKLLVFNPVYYVISGYRNVFIYKDGLGHSIGMVVYYWGVAILFLIIGTKLFKKCKDHFSDVL